VLRRASDLVSFAPPDTGAEHAVAVNSGTAALPPSLLAAGIEAGREVITTLYTSARRSTRPTPR
jgi:dTDP-4-amino-4,6-dideoxygalactose transaminase